MPWCDLDLTFDVFAVRLSLKILSGLYPQITFHRWPNGVWSADFGFWLCNQQFSDVGPMVAFQPIFMSVEFATGGPPVGQWHFLLKMVVSNNRGFLET